jgi:hypothetical protein
MDAHRLERLFRRESSGAGEFVVAIAVGLTRN